MLKLFFLLMAIINVAEIQSGDATCARTPTCPSGNFSNVCRRPCPAGGYFFQFLSGSGCLDKTEPDSGQCVANTYLPTGGRAYMQRGARRPGETNHQDTFEVEWNCRQIPALTDRIPGLRNFTFTYGRPPWGHGSTDVTSAFLASPQWDAFLSSLPLDQVDIRSCLRNFRDKMEREFKAPCKTVEVAAGLSQTAAEEMCKKKALETFILPKQATIANKEIVIQQAANTRPLWVVGHPNSNDTLADDQAEAGHIVNRCSFYPWAYQYSYRTNTSLKVVDELGEILRTRLPAVTAECRQQILKDYITNLAKMQLAKCNLPAHATGETCRQIRTGIAATLSRLGQAFPTEMNQFAGNLATRACVLPSVDLSRELRQLELSVATIGQCVSLGVGESHVLNHNYTNSPTRVDQKYRLTRLNENNFQVELNLAFSPASKASAMNVHVNKCIEKANKILLGPDNKKIILKLNHDSAIPSVPITVQPDDYRSNSANWEGDIDCETVTHEMMHLLGLVDEYHERSMGNVYNTRTGIITSVESSREANGNSYQVAVDCRVHGPDDSLMSNHWKAFGRAESIFTRRKSILRTAHFNAIAYPGCAVTNRLYYLCSRYAYETSVGHYGQGCSSGRSRECTDGASWLGGIR